MLTNHSDKTIDQITDVNGNPLVGERLMFERIISDCAASTLHWHMFYNLGLDLPIDDKPRIEIDFLLACCKGIIIIEVKGGKIERRGNRYINFARGRSDEIPDPFHQAEKYKWALFNHKVFSESEIVLATACAFPAASLPQNNRPERLWTKTEHDSSQSFADFCLDVLEKEKKNLPFTLPDLTDQDLERLLDRRLTASIYSSGYYSTDEVAEALDWLRVDDENTVESLITNDRLFFEGGPGTGKTTIAKTYIKHFPLQKGLYLCWNNMLAAKFAHKVKSEHLGTCEVSTYGAFILRFTGSRITLDELHQAGADETIRSKLRNVLQSQKADSGLYFYDYIILDEAHDYIDKGIDILLDELASIRGYGLKRGRFLVFYDQDQGYANNQRALDAYARTVSESAARFRLLDCRRVPTNKDIVLFSRRINVAVSQSDVLNIINEIKNTDGLPISILSFNSTDNLLTEIKTRYQRIQTELSGNDNILLTHSNLKRETVFGQMPLLNAIRSFAGPTPITKENVNEDFSSRWPTASILEYKGLECMNVTLVFSSNEYFDNYELYIGLTRAIQSVTILMIDNNA